MAVYGTAEKTVSCVATHVVSGGVDALRLPSDVVVASDKVIQGSFEVALPECKLDPSALVTAEGKLMATLPLPVE